VIFGNVLFSSSDILGLRVLDIYSDLARQKFLVAKDLSVHLAGGGFR
jgi:hypothetical protein